MTDPRDTDPDKAPDRAEESELARAFSLTEKLMGGGVAEAEARAEPALKQAGKTLRYWLWRAGGRRRPGGDPAQVAENYERELARLTEVLRDQGEKALAHKDKLLAKEQARVAELEQLTSQLQQACETELAKLRAQLAQRQERPPAPGEVARLSARLNETEERARLAENKVEMLKEALEITRARAAPTGTIPEDGRFREAKRAFARTFHPDQGGRGDIDRQRTFLEFWPVLERIERGE